VVWFFATSVNVSPLIKQRLPQDTTTGRIFIAVQNVKTVHGIKNLFPHAAVF
jgi:hypothetical protein